MEHVHSAKIEKCYLCGSGEELTRDHVPPRSYFPEPRPNNLLTVTCCRQCNNGFSKDDDAFRVWIASALGASEAGREIFDKKVKPAMEERLRKFAQEIQGYLREREVVTNLGPIKLGVFSFPFERVERVLIRIAKGLLTFFHPEYSYADKCFEVLNLSPLAIVGGYQFIDELTKVMKNLAYEERGECVFRCWRGFAAENPDVALVVVSFYDAAWFCVSAKPKEESHPL